MARDRLPRLNSVSLRELIFVAFFILSIFGSADGQRSVHRRRSTKARLSIRARWKSKARVAIVNDVGFHNEVYVALLWSFVRSGASVDVFVHTQATWNIESVISDWYQRPFQSTAAFLPNACSYNIVALPTFPEHHMDLLGNLTEMRCPGQRYLGVVHNPGVLTDREGYPQLMTYIAHLQPHLVALAPHTVASTVSTVRRHALTLPVSLFVPIFPIRTRAGTGPVDGAQRQGFVLQGLFESHRRSYGSTFDAILANSTLMASPKFRLNVIGRGEVTIPPALSGKIIKEEALPYGEYYFRVQTALAVLPAFASDIYYKSKASSSVAAALLCSTPLIADDQLLAAYDYLDKASVYMKVGNETDAAAMARIEGMDVADIDSRGVALKALRQRIYEQNDAVVAVTLRPPPAAGPAGLDSVV